MNGELGKSRPKAFFKTYEPADDFTIQAFKRIKLLLRRVLVS